MKNYLIYITLFTLLIANACTDKKVVTSSYSMKTTDGKVRLIVDNNENMVDEVELPFWSQKSDSSVINIYTNSISFCLQTNLDTLQFDLTKDESKTITIEKDSMMPFYFVFKNDIAKEELNFDTINKTQGLAMIYDNNLNLPYYKKLRSLYPIDSLANLGTTDLDKVKHVTSWVHNLWEHDGWNEPQNSDALYILEEVKKGQRFRCVEYGIVTAACLNSIGLPSRRLALKTSDVETRESGAGHVLLEVYLNDYQKWVMIDSQWDVIPHINGIPLSALELQEAITQGNKVELWTASKETEMFYIPWIYEYLYHFDVPIDNRQEVKDNDRRKFDNKKSLMLVPQGAKNPTVFQINNPIDHCYYSHSVKDFYAKPNFN